MKILLFSDIHIHPYKPFSYEKEGMNSRLWWSLKALDYILQYAKDNDLQPWFLGDLFEDRKTLRMEAAVATAKVMNKDRGRVWRLQVIPGNHDYYSRNSHIYDLFSSVVVNDERTVLKKGEVYIAIQPYPMDGYDQYKKFLAENKADYLFTHADMDVEKAGLDEHEIKVGATSIQSYGNFGAIYSGHYHWRQTSGNFTYLGNPLQKDFGDEGQDKGFHILDLESGQATFVPLPDYFPRFKSFEVDNKEQWEDAIRYRESRKGDYVRVVYDGSTGIPKGFDITTEPTPELVKRGTSLRMGEVRIKDVKLLNDDPVKAWIDWKKENGVFVPKGTHTFANGILGEVKK